MLYVVAFAIATGVGFTTSRLLRRPASVAQAAAVVRTVEGSLGGRRGLDAPELQRACFSEMVRHVRVDRSGRTSAPGTYALRLNPGDVAVVDEARRWFTGGLEQALRDAAGQNGWRIDGPVSISFEADPSRRPGVPSAVPAPSQAEAPPGDRPTPGASSALAVERADNGLLVPLDGAAVTVGRSPDNTITTVDERISRSHARLEQIDGGWAVVDLDSANGTTVDGRRIRAGVPVPLRPGSTVGVGPLDLHVVDRRAIEGGRPDPSRRSGTRALGEAERTRISQEVLGLPGDARPR